MNEKSIVEREKLFIHKQKLLAESIELLDEFMSLSMELRFDEAAEIKARIDAINKEVLTYEKAVKSLALDMVMGVEEASEQWGLSSGYIKNLCAEGKIHCKKIGKTWIIDKSQPIPNLRGKVKLVEDNKDS
ncbi:helix-turn-helix domain-containing protein [Bacillus sp. GM_Baccil_2]|uniref:helix-turn-helix domain-containing protein n=1 Tax=Bacillus sp. GM_Baccil_2 TaxID=2937369 RepID=UPI00226980B4